MAVPGVTDIIDGFDSKAGRASMGKSSFTVWLTGFILSGTPVLHMQEQITPAIILGAGILAYIASACGMQWNMLYLPKLVFFHAASRYQFPL